ncbi:uncharacterized protein LOC125947422 [Dermacentor silvarum]|uniref:uncharacterized protein LOC125947422 n=1 Tax=Dermacentor silvarum TaxID=543639 RepID=UPI0021017108|nr:uncharacterized protein LOC125947422 [Dermacentor silvarum]
MAKMSTETADFLLKYMSNTSTGDIDWMRVSMMVAADLLNEQSKRKRKPIRQILKQRRQLSEYFTLVQEMRCEDDRYFFEYFRMSVERFDRILALVELLLRPKRVTCNTLSAGGKLAFTLMYLAHGSTMSIIAKSYRIADSTATQVIRQTCRALRHVLEPIYVSSHANNSPVEVNSQGF